MCRSTSGEVAESQVATHESDLHVQVLDVSCVKICVIILGRNPYN